MNKALLVIDMQRGSFTEASPRFDTPGIVERINQLARAFRADDQTVIFVQHDGSALQEFIPESEPWKLLEGLEVMDTDVLISKTANDVFYHSTLEDTLRSRNVEEVYITGCATDFCVESTIQSALTKDFHLTVVQDGHTTGERPNLTAKQVIDHYNWVWQNMLPTQGSIQVISTEKILSSST